ncbi:MAG: carboxymuconolactone decarboxylase family protein [Dehalococcoidia bacterium]
MILTEQQRELVAIGASVGAGCFSCLDHHVTEAGRVGLDESIILRAVEDAECVKRSAYNELAAHARKTLRLAYQMPPDCCSDSTLGKEFVSLGSAVAANAPQQLQKHVEGARAQGMTEAQIGDAIAVARQVQSSAASITARELPALEVAREANAPIWLTATGPGAAEGEACGPDCGCQQEAVAVGADADTTGKCC